jgi:hypothetical protein
VFKMAPKGVRLVERVRLVLPDAASEGPGLGDIAGWLDDTHPFLFGVDEIVAGRNERLPRVLKHPRDR